MLAFLVRRVVAGILTLFVIATICFILTRIAPGSPFTTERSVHPEIIKNFEAFYGLDKPVHIQYFRTLGSYFQGDLGPSMYYRDLNCNDIVWPGLRKSLVLGILSIVVALLLGIPLGLIASARQNRFEDYAASSISIFGICVPNFLLGPLLISLFTFALDWLPPGGWPADWSWMELRKLIMPTFTLAMVHVAYISRLGRAGMLDVMNKDFIRTARAKGASRWSVFMKHGLKNGITPVVSYLGPMVAIVFTGSLVVEMIFVIPGLGQHFVKSALNRDMNLIMACVLVFAFLVIVLNTLVDLIYGLLDPRVRVS